MHICYQSENAMLEFHFWSMHWTLKIIIHLKHLLWSRGQEIKISVFVIELLGGQLN
jgi:hypothetical protein